jgi:hypothetical protein
VTVYGIDAPAEFLPGHTIGGVSIASVEIYETAQRLQAHVRTTEEAATPCAREMIRRMIAAELGERLRTYIVKAVHDDRRLDLVPPADAPHLPEMSNVEQWVTGGILVKPIVGAEVLVMFRDQDHARPIVLAFDTQTPERVSVGGVTADANAAREGDTVQVLFPPAVFTGMIGGVPSSGVLTFPTMYSLGNIQTGSTKMGITT